MVRDMNGETDAGAAAWIDVALAEYEAHRDEVVAEAAAQQQILALGTTAIGIVFAGAFTVWDDQLLATFAFMIAVPLISAFVLIQWAGRAAAMMRVGVYLERLETSLARGTNAPAPVLSWERTLAGMRPDKPWKPQAGWNDFGAVGVFALLAGGSVALGAYRGWSGHEAAVSLFTVLEYTVLVLIVIAVGRGVATARHEARLNFPEVQ